MERDSDQDPEAEQPAAAPPPAAESPAQPTAEPPPGRVTVTMLHETGTTTKQSATTTTHGSSGRYFSGYLPRPRDTDRKYVRGDDLGQGGMGDVHKALDLDLRRMVAMKVLRHRGSESRFARFFEEAQVTGQLEHPNIVPVHDLGITQDGRPFFTMKLVKGRGLDEILTDLQLDKPAMLEEWPLSRLAGALIGVCNGIAYAHEHGVVHRDLKPSNIMLGSFGEVLVMDWGLAKIGAACGARQQVQSVREDLIRRSKAKSRIRNRVETEGGIDLDAPEQADQERMNNTLTQDGSVLGTPVYMPPEQAEGRLGCIDERTDIYALGAILYEMLCLEPPVDGTTARAVLNNVKAGRIPLPSQRAPDRVIPRELEAIAMQALQRRPEDRYQRVTDLKRDLERFLTGHAVSVKEDNLLESMIKLIKRNQTAAVVMAIGLFSLMLTVTIAFVVVLGYWQDAQTTLDELRAEQAKRTQLQDQIRKEGQRFWHQEHQEYLDRGLFDRWALTTGWTQGMAIEPRPLTQQQKRDWLSLQGSGLRVGLRNENLHMVYREHIGGSVRVRYSFTAKASGSGGTHACLGGDAWNRGYVFQLGGWQNSDRQRTAILRGDGRQPRLLAQDDFIPQPGVLYEVEASMVRQAGLVELSLRIGDQLLLQASDPDPLLEGHDRPNVALWWGSPSTVYLHRAIIDRLGEPLKTDLLEVAERHLAKGNYDTAIDLYQEVYDSFTDLERRKRAEQGLERARAARKNQGKVEWWRKKLGRHWPASTWSLELHEGVVTCMLSGDRIDNLRPILGYPINRLTLEGTGITDLGGIERLPLTHLVMLGGGGIHSLEPLAGMPLQHLHIETNFYVQDLSALADMPLRQLHLENFSKLRDVSDVAGAPLQYVDFSRCRALIDIDAVIGSDLEVLKISGCTGLFDLSALQFAPLQHVVLDQSHLPQASQVLPYHPTLETISVQDDYAFDSEEFWYAYESGLFDNPNGK
jgi:serine/threonine protein kinase